MSAFIVFYIVSVIGAVWANYLVVREVGKITVADLCSFLCVLIPAVNTVMAIFVLVVEYGGITLWERKE